VTCVTTGRPPRLGVIGRYTSGRIGGQQVAHTLPCQYTRRHACLANSRQDILVAVTVVFRVLISNNLTLGQLSLVGSSLHRLLLNTLFCSFSFPQLFPSFPVLGPATPLFDFFTSAVVPRRKENRPRYHRAARDCWSREHLGSHLEYVRTWYIILEPRPKRRVTVSSRRDRQPEPLSEVDRVFAAAASQPTFTS